MTVAGSIADPLRAETVQKLSPLLLHLRGTRVRVYSGEAYPTASLSQHAPYQASPSTASPSDRASPSPLSRRPRTRAIDALVSAWAQIALALCM